MVLTKTTELRIAGTTTETQKTEYSVTLKPWSVYYWLEMRRTVATRHYNHHLNERTAETPDGFGYNPRALWVPNGKFCVALHLANSNAYVHWCLSYWVAVTDHSYVNEDTKSRLNFGNVCYHSVQNLSVSLNKLTPKYQHKLFTWPCVACECEIWSLVLREERRWGYSRTGWRGEYFDIKDRWGKGRL